MRDWKQALAGGGRRAALAGVWLIAAAGCSPSHNPNLVQNPDSGPSDNCVETTRRCDGLKYQLCSGSNWGTTDTCAAFCDVSLGCIDCPVNGTLCDGDNVIGCDGAGHKTGVRTTCKDACVNGTCTDACGMAAAELSYLGCDYFPTVTVNSSLINEAHFAVAVANPQTEDVTVSVSQGARLIKQVTVPAGSLSTIMLDWVPALQRARSTDLVPSGAYKLTSSAPVTAFQFNPIEYQVQGCTDPFTGGPCYTFTNDASLLLPSSTLTSHYMAIARESFLLKETSGGVTSLFALPGFIAIVNADTVPANVQVRFTANTKASASGIIQAYHGGQTGSFTLQNQGDVLQLLSDSPTKCAELGFDNGTDSFGNPIVYGYCDVPTTDLTGSEITADHKIAVFAGHDCTFIPFNRWACDHLEQQMLPLESWGKDYVGSHTLRQPSNIPDVWRVVSAADNNMISFDPPTVQMPVILNRGEWYEFVTPLDFEATASGPFQLVQYMTGEAYKGFGTGASNPGDPAMSLSVPVEQYRKDYIFLTPDTYTVSYVNVAAPAGMDVMLDGASVDRALFKAVGTGGKYQAARVKVDPGTHHITGAMAFGIAVYGLAPYTSYMYPGGLDVKMINIQ